MLSISYRSIAKVMWRSTASWPFPALSRQVRQTSTSSELLNQGAVLPTLPQLPDLPSASLLLPDADTLASLLASASGVVQRDEAKSSSSMLGQGPHIAGSGSEWMWLPAPSASEAAVAKVAADAVKEPLPTDPLVLSKDDSSTITASTNAALDILESLLPVSTLDQHSGYMAYIPSGGNALGGIASFVGAATNRYVVMQSAAPGLAAIEAIAIRWLAQDVLGMSGPAVGGVFTTGGSFAMLTALHVARFAKLKRDPTTGAWPHTARVYTSDQCHHALLKSLALTGFSPAALRVIPTDARFRMDTRMLCAAIDEDISRGYVPFLISATAGTTAMGTVDPLETISTIARDRGLWFHVDAAYGGGFNLTETGKAVLKGISTADSVVIDPHKALFSPYGTGALCVADQTLLKAAHATDTAPSYRPPSATAVDGCSVQASTLDASAFLPPCSPNSNLLEDPFVDSPSDLCVELTRDFRGLRVWLPFKALGSAVFTRSLDSSLLLARWAAQCLAALPNIALLDAEGPQLSVVAFHLVPPFPCSPKEKDDLNIALLKAVNADGRVLLSPVRIARPNLPTEGQFGLRMCVLSHRTTGVVVKAVVDLVRDWTPKLLQNRT